ncbi:G-type lectin S-receptor-like serine/threonine-protein kinase At2g19130 [Camellia sinensis]|uniref:G-type lectin S-receptor-like serine/threonine-protein kinase At2g19130 n=1 Tax=Camellia sinensis TaxID=4442 RepID=UPI0010369561|nr:G-type lectin S-receptor-like serine/threonine-protein kinase At2g19130 [Camellia sinensis]
MGIRNNPYLLFYVFFQCCFSFITNQLSLGAVDTISTTQSLSGDQTIVSAGGTFETGFYKPDISGQVKQLAWLDANKKWNSYWAQPRPQCKVYAFCWAFGTCNENTLPFCNCPNGFNPLSSNEWNSMSYSGGCVKRTKLVCGNNHEKDMFWEYPNTRLPKHPQSVFAKTVAECEATCLNNCSSTAYPYDSNGCSIWIENLLNMQKLLENDDRGRTLYIRVVVSKYSNGKNIKWIIGVILGSVSIVVVFSFLIFLVRKRKQVETLLVYCSLVAFRYKDVQKATKNFKEKMGG